MEIEKLKEEITKIKEPRRTGYGNIRHKLEDIIAEGNTAFSSEDGVLFNKDKTSLICCSEGKEGSYEIPSSVQSIAPSAFAKCEKLTSITAPEGSSLTSIGEKAFNECRSLQNINLPAGLTSITIGETEANPFMNCNKLTAINVADGNNAFLSVDGVLFNEEKTKLICCPAGKAGSYEIPSGITSVETWAFYRCNQLTSVTIPNTVTSIGTKAFNYCSGLTSVTIPNTVTSIGNNAFSSCSGLTTVTFENVTPPTIGNAIFNSCSNLTTIMVPAGSAETYKTVSNLAPYKEKITAAPAVHKHPICGTAGCTDPNHPDGHDTEISWTAISDESGLKAMANGGHYYLADNIDITDVITIKENTEVALCLNGKTITQTGSGKNIFKIGTADYGGAELTAILNICDCSADNSGILKYSESVRS